MASRPKTGAVNIPRLQSVVEELSQGAEGSAMERKRIAVVVRDEVMATPLPTSATRGSMDYLQSPEEFLERLQNFCLVTGVADDKRLTHVVPAALEHGANWWWRFVRGFDSWEQFTAAFRSEFSSIGAKRRLKAKLEQRTQHPEENFKKFIYAIATFYGCIREDVSESEKGAARTEADAPSALRFGGGARLQRPRRFGEGSRWPNRAGLASPPVQTTATSGQPSSQRSGVLP
ncbi:hypothetical protein MRX96_013856 [Rhipicephalus microplus]